MVLTGVLWGSTGIGVKQLTAGGLDSFLITGIPFLIGAGLVFLTAGAAGNTLRSWTSAMALGVVATALPTALFNLGLRYLPVGVTALMVSLAPVFTNLAAHVVFPDEPFTRAKARGLAIAVAGAGLLAAGTSAPGTGGSLLGFGLVAAGVVVAGTSGVWTRMVALRWGARRMIGPQLLGAGLAATLVGVLWGDPVSLGSVDTGGWLILLAIGVGAQYVGFRSILAVNERATASLASVVAYVIPVVGVLGGAILLDEEVTLPIVAGGALIMVGVATLSRAARLPRPERAAPGETLTPAP